MGCSSPHDTRGRPYARISCTRHWCPQKKVERGLLHLWHLLWSGLTPLLRTFAGPLLPPPTVWPCWTTGHLSFVWPCWTTGHLPFVWPCWTTGQPPFVWPCWTTGHLPFVWPCWTTGPSPAVVSQRSTARTLTQLWDIFVSSKSLNREVCM